MAGMDLSTRGYRGRVVVALRGELDLAGAAGAALAALTARAGQIIIDLAGLEFIDCSGLASLAGARSQARQGTPDSRSVAPHRNTDAVIVASCGSARLASPR